MVSVLYTMLFIIFIEEKKVMSYVILGMSGILLSIFIVKKLLNRVCMNLAIGRKTVDIRKYKRAHKFTRLITEAEGYGEWIASQETEIISIRSRDGYNLTGHFLPSENPQRTLLMVHGWRSGWIRDFAAMAEKLHRCGCNLLLIEQRAHGKSEGKYIGFGVLERYDCKEWIAYLTNRQGGHLPIYLAGLSMGASTVLMTAGMELPEEVKGVIADCGFTSPYEMVARVAKTVFHLNSYMVNQINHMCRKKAGYSLNEYTTLEAMEACRIPIFFVHGTADSFVPMDMTLQNYQACKAKKELYLVEGAEHCKSFMQDKDGYIAALHHFFDWNNVSTTL